MNYVPGRIVVRFVKETTQEQMYAVIKKYPVHINKMLIGAKAASLDCLVGEEEHMCRLMTLAPEIDYMKKMQTASV